MLHFKFCLILSNFYLFFRCFDQLYTINSLRDQIVQNVRRFEPSSPFGSGAKRQAVFDVVFRALHEALPKMEFYEIIQPGSFSNGTTKVSDPLDPPPGLEGLRSLAWPMHCMTVLAQTEELKKEFPFIAKSVSPLETPSDDNQWQKGATQSTVIKPVKNFHYVRFEQPSNLMKPALDNQQKRKSIRFEGDSSEDDLPDIVVPSCPSQPVVSPLQTAGDDVEEGAIEEAVAAPSVDKAVVAARVPLKEIFDNVSIFRKRWMQIAKSNQKFQKGNPNGPVSKKPRTAVNLLEEMKPLSESNKGRGLVSIDQLPNGCRGSQGKRYLAILFRTHANGAQELGWTLFHSFTNDYKSSHIILEKGIAPGSDTKIDEFKFGTTLFVQATSSIKEVLRQTIDQTWDGPVVTFGCDMARTVLSNFLEFSLDKFEFYDVREEYLAYKKTRGEMPDKRKPLPTLVDILNALGMCADLPMNAGNMSRYILMAFMKVRNV